LFAPCSKIIALMMEAASTSETLMNFYQTARRNNPEGSHLHTRRREKVKFHFLHFLLWDQLYSLTYQSL
jgi:hypothetical protein